MFFWGIVLTIAGVLTVLVSFLSSLNIFADMSALGFAEWLNRFFAVENLTGKKVAFFIAAVLLVAGIVLFFVGKARNAKAGESDAATQKSAKFFRDVKGEFKKITWPTVAATTRNTGVTLVVCALLGAFICLVDLGLGQLIKLMLG